jgi:hypothetical protein
MNNRIRPHQEEKQGQVPREEKQSQVPPSGTAKSTPSKKKRAREEPEEEIPTFIESEWDQEQELSMPNPAFSAVPVQLRVQGQEQQQGQKQEQGQEQGHEPGQGQGQGQRQEQQQGPQQELGQGQGQGKEQEQGPGQGRARTDYISISDDEEDLMPPAKRQKVSATGPSAVKIKPEQRHSDYEKYKNNPKKRSAKRKKPKNATGLPVPPIAPLNRSSGLPTLTHVPLNGSGVFGELITCGKCKLQKRTYCLLGSINGKPKALFLCDPCLELVKSTSTRQLTFSIFRQGEPGTSKNSGNFERRGFEFSPCPGTGHHDWRSVCSG